MSGLVVLLLFALAAMAFACAALTYRANRFEDLAQHLGKLLGASAIEYGGDTGFITISKGTMDRLAGHHRVSAQALETGAFVVSANRVPDEETP